MDRLGLALPARSCAKLRRRSMMRLRAGCTLLLSVLWLACSGAGGEARPRYRMVNPGVGFEMLRDNPELVVLDVRLFDEYLAPAGHLERAVSAPLLELGYLWPLLDLSDQDTVLIYDGNGSVGQIQAAQFLIDRGLRFVVQIDGGFEAWLAKGFGVVVEDAPLSPIRPD
ncbi:MAG: rhodanese-like domain-containing protein [Acidobacteria bacterium]|nr:rhodanese-like domain-containing protein [Acidobacteriota bacterium]